jgi:hypothetical protein
VLTHFTDLAAVASAASADDEVLLALLRLARSGDQLAARAAMQAMLGAAVRLARRTQRYADGDHEEALARAVAALWQVVRDYPVERRVCRPADGISLDVLSLLTGTARARSAEVPVGLPAEVGDRPEDDDGDESGLRADFWSAVRLSGAPGCSDEQLVLVLAWAARTGVLSLPEVRLLVKLNLSVGMTEIPSCREVADELGLAHDAVRQRASRATRRLALAVRRLALGSDAGLARAA